MRRRRFLVLLSMVPLWRTAAAAEMRGVAEVRDGETLTLGDGSEIRLAGILAPRPPLGWSPERPWRAAVEAKAALSALALGRDVELRRSGEVERDRYGRILAQVYRD